MEKGDVIGDRFVIEGQVAAGGMGLVFSALDRSSGERVAFKVLQRMDPEVEARFAREARVLAELRHASIVRYVAHGTLPDGGPYIAMEWLEGEDLRDRLERQALEPSDAIALVTRIAEALAVAHERGIVHRDVKPDNIFLPGRRLDAPKLLDFGIARVVGDAAQLTQVGAVLGTPAYMSPEQVVGADTIDARSDLFSLGCVLFECLVGRPPFAGPNVAAVMAKIVLEEAPRLAEHCPSLPLALDDLVARLLHKERVRRPADAGALAIELAELRLDEGPRAGSIRPPALTGTENRLVCVVLTEGRAGHVSRPIDPLDGTMPSSISEDLARLVRIGEKFSTRIETLIDGSVVAIATGAGSAVDLCARAARSAIELRALLPGVRIAMGTGRAVVSAALPVGQVIESVAALLALPVPDESAIRIDAVGAGLLDVGFVVERDASGALLRSERDSRHDSRRLLGMPTPCVGRERELVRLGTIYDECVDESVARAVLVTGPAGVGKSRLLRELLVRLRHQGNTDAWIGRGDPMRQGSPLGLLAQIIRQTAAIRDGEPPDEGRRKLKDRVALHAREADVQRVAEFLGELCGLPFGDEHSLQLRAAREQPMLMADQMRRAFEDFLIAECATTPVVLVFEDLQWGDLPTIKFVDAALRNVKDRPLFVLAMARPEVSEVFPDLWAERNLTHVRLGELTRKACEKLVRAVLGEKASDLTVARIVEVSGGNAFYLEELIRAVAEGHGDDLPGTVLAMAQARLEGLPPGPRQALRAASIFGETFWRAGLTALLGQAPTVDVEASTQLLLERELMVRHADTRFPEAGDEYTFRHSLLREASYAMLTDHDKALGHRLAAAWLERAGEKDAAVLAGHFDRGAERGRAAEWYRRAAEQALDASDLEAVLAHADRATKCEARGEALAAVRLLEATAHHWRAEYPACERAAIDALRGLPPRSARWFHAAEEVAEAMLPQGKIASLTTLSQALQCPPGQEAPLGPFLISAATVAMQLFLAGKHDAAEAVMTRLEAAEGRLQSTSPIVEARCHFARATRAMLAGNLGLVLQHARAAVDAFDEAGDARNAALMRSNLGSAYIDLGATLEAEESLRAACAVAERLGLPQVIALSKLNLSLALVHRGALAEAEAIQRESIDLFDSNQDERMQGLSRIYLARALLASKEVEGAKQQVKDALRVLKGTPPMQAYAMAVLAEVLGVSGDVTGAVDAAISSVKLLETLGAIEEGEAYVRYTYALTLTLSGNTSEARTVIATASKILRAKATKITQPTWRESFLARVPENAATLSLEQALASG